MKSLAPLAIAFFLYVAPSTPAQNPLLPKQELLEKETFWDNKDWEWYKSNIPFFECPDSEIQTTYYYRWELLTKHLTYGSPNSGYSFTEFIDRPFWSGTYGAISCPAGLQLYEARWLRDSRYARDYSRYWLKTPGRNLEITAPGWLMPSGPPTKSIPTKLSSPIYYPASRPTMRAGKKDSLSPKWGYSGKPATMTAWNSTLTAGRQKTSCGVPPHTGPQSTPTCTRMPSPSPKSRT